MNVQPTSPRERSDLARLSARELQRTSCSLYLATGEACDAHRQEVAR